MGFGVTKIITKISRPKEAIENIDHRRISMAIFYSKRCTKGVGFNTAEKLIQLWSRKTH